LINPISDEELDEHLELAMKLIPEHWLRRCLEELKAARITIKTMRQQHREDMKDASRDAREAASEAYWQGKQGDEYGSY
jgi:tryptophan 2,3-dioxygenase